MRSRIVPSPCPSEVVRRRETSPHRRSLRRLAAQRAGRRHRGHVEERVATGPLPPIVLAAVSRRASTRYRVGRSGSEPPSLVGGDPCGRPHWPAAALVARANTGRDKPVSHGAVGSNASARRGDPCGRPHVQHGRPHGSPLHAHVGHGILHSSQELIRQRIDSSEDPPLLVDQHVHRYGPDLPHPR